MITISEINNKITELKDLIKNERNESVRTQYAIQLTSLRDALYKAIYIKYE